MGPDPKWYVIHTTGGLYVCATLLGPSEEMGDAAWCIRGRLLTGPAVEDASRCTNMIASYGLVIYDSLSPPYSAPYRGQRSGQLPSWQTPQTPQTPNVLLAEVEATIPITHLIQLCRMEPAAIRRTKTLLLFGARGDGDICRCDVPTERPHDELSDDTNTALADAPQEPSDNQPVFQVGDEVRVKQGARHFAGEIVKVSVIGCAEVCVVGRQGGGWLRHEDLERV